MVTFVELMTLYVTKIDLFFLFFIYLHLQTNMSHFHHKHKTTNTNYYGYFIKKKKKPKHMLIQNLAGWERCSMKNLIVMCILSHSIRAAESKRKRE